MTRRLASYCAALAALSLAVVPLTASTQDATGRPVRPPDVVFVPTPEPVVSAMLDVAKVGKGDVVYDLGCGDGRIAIQAAKRGAKKSVCVDIDPQRIREARENARAAGVADKVTIIEGDLFEQDFSDATVVSLYLLPELNLRLRPKILALKPGTRVVSHDFDMGDWKPERTEVVEGKTIYAWHVPDKGKVQARSLK
ncbi:MAG: methyltransferase domain-containing protein [Anaeromyxobacteraceae bacterium]